MDKTEKLTEERYWDQIWEAHELPQILKTEKRHYHVDIIDSYFHNFLPRDKTVQFLEIGCAPGRWLHYFHEEFGYEVSGLEHSRTGFHVTKKNLDLLNVEANLYYGDFLHYRFERQFDVVFSQGLLEHFDNTALVLQKHVDLIKPQGYLVVGVPNLFSPLYMPLQNLFNKQSLAQHVKILPSDFIRLSGELGLETIYCGYAGVFNLWLLNIPQSKKLSCSVVRLIQAPVNVALRMFRAKRETFVFSPYIFYFGRK